MCEGDDDEEEDEDADAEGDVAIRGGVWRAARAAALCATAARSGAAAISSDRIDSMYSRAAVRAAASPRPSKLTQVTPGLPTMSRAYDQTMSGSPSLR